MDTRYSNLGKIIREWFPEQTKSIPAMLVWSLVLIADIVLIFWLCGRFEFDLFTTRYAVAILVGGGFLLLCLEAAVYNKIIALFR